MSGYTFHAWLRCQERDISQEEICFVVKHGICERTHSQLKYYFTTKRLNQIATSCKLITDLLYRCQRVVVITAPNGRVITVYENDSPKQFVDVTQNRVTSLRQTARWSTTNRG